MIARVTQIESFRRFITGVPGSCETDLIASITGQFQGNNKTRIGSAFHSIIETGENIDKGVIFNDSQIEIARQHAANISPFFSEIRSNKKYLDKIIISGCTDVIQGCVIRDTKVKFRALSEIEYFNSYQWRFYLDIFELNRFIYDVFEIVGYSDEMGLNVSKLEMRQNDPFEFDAYEGMQKDLEAIIIEFLNWVEFRHLEKYFELPVKSK